ncbi:MULTISPECIES: oxygenase MpaB family protein [unclassified Pseudomonas]|uniref:oxygenase MpaB family protein n=1 Tax=unclassified Pseudomonas TaxID=196821 RepID=UPI0030DD8ECE
MSMLAEKDRDVEMALDQKFLSLSAGRTAPPGGFLYSQAYNAKAGNDLRKAFKMVTGVSAGYDEKQAFKIAMSGWVGDPLSDVAILKIRREGRDVHAVMQSFLNEGIKGVSNAPEELEQIWQQVSAPPPWVDWKRIENGAKIYRRFGVEGHRYQGISSLDMYRVLSIARTLMSTGQYADDTAYKRFLLTCNFWTQISEPNGMKIFNEGWKVTLRVRLLHTLIRRAVFGSPRWEHEQFGMPINQSGMLTAPLISSVMMCKSLQILGYKVTDEEVEDVIHLWQYVAYIMGYQQENVFPSDIKGAVQAMHDSLLLNPPSEDPDCIRLGRSFLDSFKPSKDAALMQRARQWVDYKIGIAHSAFFVSPDTRRAMGTPNPWLWAALYASTQFPKNRIQDLRRLSSPSYAAALDEKVRAARNHWLQTQLTDADMNYRPKSKY